MIVGKESWKREEMVTRTNMEKNFEWFLVVYLIVIAHDRSMTSGSSLFFILLSTIPLPQPPRGSMAGEKVSTIYIAEISPIERTNRHVICFSNELSITKNNFVYDGYHLHQITCHRNRRKGSRCVTVENLSKRSSRVRAATWRGRKRKGACQVITIVLLLLCED